MNDTPDANSNAADEEAELAPRLTRLGASLLDGLTILPFGIALFAYSGSLDLVLKHQVPSLSRTVLMSFFGWVIFLATNSYPLIKYGQTIGKYLCKTQMVTLAGDVPAFWRLAIFRYGSMQLMGFLGIFGLVDPLLIFRRNRRCLHDLLAGTKVVIAKPLLHQPEAGDT